MKKYFLLAALLLLTTFINTCVLAMEPEEKPPLFHPIPIHHLNIDVLPNPCSTSPTQSDFADPEKSYWISPSCVEEACKRPGNLFFKNRKCFQITHMTSTCDYLKNYCPSDRLLECHPFNPQEEIWYCQAMINNGLKLNVNDIYISFKSKRIKSADTKTRSRDDDDVLQERHEDQNKRFRETSNEMDII